jgi:phosphatidylserine/phosphatidylglycerophosphate/cardiolipin synthase-like enzyme
MKRVVAMLALTLTSCLPVQARAGPDLPALAAVPGGARAVGAGSVALITDGGLAVRRIVAAIDSARRSVHAEIYEFDRPEILAAMLDALGRGVTVAVIVDATVAVNIPTVTTLRAAGAEVLEFPDGRLQIDHVKLLVVDGALAVFGGMNWGRKSYLNHDFDVAVRGPAVARLEAIFARDLVRSGEVSVSPPPMVPSPAGLRLLTSYPADEVRPAVLDAIDGASRFVFIEMYVLTDAQVMAALGRAVARGVNAWILFDPNQDLNRAAAARLDAAGVSVRFFRTSGEKLHAKAMVVDGRTLVVGSANWTSSGFTRNHELDAVIGDEGLASEALARMERDWRASAP